MKVQHLFLMIGLVAGAVLLATGDVGGWLFLLWPLACLAMVVAMVWGMGGVGKRESGRASHTHQDGVTHAHR